MKAEEAQAQLDEAKAEIERLQGYLERANWRRCDIAACNCNGYHNWNPTRQDIEEPLKEEIARLKVQISEFRKRSYARKLRPLEFKGRQVVRPCKECARLGYTCRSCKIAADILYVLAEFEKLEAEQELKSSELTRLRAENEELRKALECLMDAIPCANYSDHEAIELGLATRRATELFDRKT